MKFLFLILCFSLASNVQAQSFKVLSHSEFKKLSKQQQIEYIKEFAKRMSIKPKTPGRSTSNIKTSFYQMVLSEMIGLPMAHAEDENPYAQEARIKREQAEAEREANRARAEAEREALDKRASAGGVHAEYLENQKKRAKEQAEIQDRSKSLIVDDNERARLETNKISLEGKQDDEKRAIKEKLEVLNQRVEEKQRAVKANDDKINETQARIIKLEQDNITATSYVDGDDVQKVVEKNNREINKLNDRLESLRERDGELKADINGLKQDNQSLSQSLRSPELQKTVKENTEKLANMDKLMAEKNQALAKLAELNKKATEDAAKIAAQKKELDELQDKREYLKKLRDQSKDDPRKVTDLTNQMDSIDKVIKEKEGKIAEAQKDARIQSFSIRNLALKTGVEVTIDENHNPKVIKPKGKVTDEEQKPANPFARNPAIKGPLPEKQKNAAQEICSKNPVPSGYEAVCHELKKQGLLTDKATPPKDQPAAKPEVDTAKPAPQTPTTAAVPEKKNDSKADPKEDKPKDAKEPADYCPNAGFIVPLEDANTNLCPAITDAAKGNYVGKLTEGPAAKASCPNEKFGKGQTVMCYPLLYGLTKENDALCVTPSSNASERCFNEAKNRNTFEKAVEIASANPDAYNHYYNIYQKMCMTNVTKHARRTDTLATCKALGEVWQNNKEVKIPNQTEKPGAAK